MCESEPLVATDEEGVRMGGKGRGASLPLMADNRDVGFYTLLLLGS